MKDDRQPSPADLQVGQDLENWPTAVTDQKIALEVLRRHSDRFGSVRLPERIEKVSDQDGGTFRVTIPAWVHELEDRFNAIHGNVTGPVVTEKTLRWLHRTVFRESATVKVG